MLSITKLRAELFLAQKERDAVISAEAAAERNTASSFTPPAPKPFHMGAFENEAQNKVIAAVET